MFHVHGHGGTRADRVGTKFAWMGSSKAEDAKGGSSGLDEVYSAPWLQTCERHRCWGFWKYLGEGVGQKKVQSGAVPVEFEVVRPGPGLDDCGPGPDRAGPFIASFVEGDEFVASDRFSGS
jgi:hypothetical protein